MREGSGVPPYRWKGRLMLRFYYYSQSDLAYKKISRRKVWGWAAAIVILSSFLTMMSGYFGIDPFGLKALRTEAVADRNSELMTKLASLNGKLNNMQKDMRLLDRSDNIIRTTVDLPEISRGVEEASIGGVEENPEYVASNRANELISRATQSLDALNREAKLQERSFSAIRSKYRSNLQLFKHIPAIEPIRGGIISDGFGMRFHPILHIMLMHEGIDIEAPVGTPVHVSGDGVVTYVGRRGGYGNLVEVDNGFGYQTLYAHLSKFLVTVGEKVKRGQVIALSGDTGLSTGPHLHYGVMKDGVFVNPADYFFKGQQYEAKKLYDVASK